MHSEQMPSQFLGVRRTMGYFSEPDLIRPLDGEILASRLGAMGQSWRLPVVHARKRHGVIAWIP